MFASFAPEPCPIMSCVRMGRSPQLLISCALVTAILAEISAHQHQFAYKPSFHLPSTSFLSPTPHKANKWQQELAEVEEQSAMLLQQQQEQDGTDRTCRQPTPSPVVYDISFIDFDHTIDQLDGTPLQDLSTEWMRRFSICSPSVICT